MNIKNLKLLLPSLIIEPYKLILLDKQKGYKHEKNVNLFT